MEGWIAVSRSANVCCKPKQVSLRGTRYVTWRTPSNQVRFIPDACKHRGASLSMGNVEPDGCLKCVYHAWRYDDKGYNTFDGLRTEFSNHRMLRTKEQDGLLWVTNGSGTGPPKSTCEDTIWIEHWYDQCAQIVFESWVMPSTDITMPYTAQFGPNIMITVCPLNEHTCKIFVGFSRKDGVPIWLFDILNGNKLIVEQIDKDFRYKGDVEPFVKEWREKLWTYDFR